MSPDKSDGLKSAYDLAMERAERETGSSMPVTDEQKRRLAEVDQRLEAEIAEIEIFSQQAIAAASITGQADELRTLQEDRIEKIRKARERAEAEKDDIRK